MFINKIYLMKWQNKDQRIMLPHQNHLIGSSKQDTIGNQI